MQSYRGPDFIYVPPKINLLFLSWYITPSFYLFLIRFGFDYHRYVSLLPIDVIFITLYARMIVEPIHLCT